MSYQALEISLKHVFFLACLHLSIHLSELQLFSFVIYCLQVEHEKC